MVVVEEAPVVCPSDGFVQADRMRVNSKRGIIMRRTTPIIADILFESPCRLFIMGVGYVKEMLWIFR
jgi:hypothetical protein